MKGSQIEGRQTAHSTSPSHTRINLTQGAPLEPYAAVFVDLQNIEINPRSMLELANGDVLFYARSGLLQDHLGKIRFYPVIKHALPLGSIPGEETDPAVVVRC